MREPAFVPRIGARVVWVDIYSERIADQHGAALSGVVVAVFGRSMSGQPQVRSRVQAYAGLIDRTFEWDADAGISGEWMSGRFAMRVAQ